MLLEVFTGKRPTDSMFIGELTIRHWVHHAFPSQLACVLDDQLLHDDVPSTSDFNHILVPIFDLGLLCSSDTPDETMTMKDVVVALKKLKRDYINSTSGTTLTTAQ